MSGLGWEQVTPQHYETPPDKELRKMHCWNPPKCRECARSLDAQYVKMSVSIDYVTNGYILTMTRLTKEGGHTYSDVLESTIADTAEAIPAILEEWRKREWPPNDRLRNMREVDL